MLIPENSSGITQDIVPQVASYHKTGRKMRTQKSAKHFINPQGITVPSPTDQATCSYQPIMTVLTIVDEFEVRIFCKIYYFYIKIYVPTQLGQAPNYQHNILQ